jgi:hypothetical protein
MHTFTRLFLHVLLVGISSLLAIRAVAQSATPLAANGQLRVIGKQLSNESGKAIQLRGMSTHGLHWFPQCYTQGSMQALANDWGADVVRAAMYVKEGGYENNRAGLRDKVNQIVDWTEANGMYCIIDFHTLNPGNPNDYLADAKEFFQIMAQRNAGKKNVIYEICNEPNGVDWNTIKSYADQIIPIVRQYAPNSVILVGTPNYCQRPQDVLSAPLTYANILYTFHFYSASHFFQSDIKNVSNQLPLFCSEWGTSTYSGGGNIDLNNAQNWLDMMAGQNPGGQKMSWCNWTYSQAGESSAALNSGACDNQQWNNTSPSGTWVKEHILSPVDDFGPATPSVAITSPTNNATVTIGSSVVITASVSNTTATSVEFYNGTTKLDEDATAPYSFTLSNVAAGTYSLTTKALFSSGSPLTSPAVQITAAPAPNQVPTTALTAPTTNAQFTMPATINLAASASDPDGSVAKVEFFNGSTKLGEDVTAPYTFSWTNVPAGTYTLTSKATDNQGATATSAAVTVSVIDPNAPTADLIGPDCAALNSVITFEVNSRNLPNATNFSWWCTGSTQSITTANSKATINFGPSFSGGQVCVGINYSAAPWYQQFCKNVTVCAPGTTPPPTPTPNQVPTVTLTSPANNTQFTAPATINLTATASDTDGTITKVEFYTGSTKLGESATSPYQFNWTNVAAGNYTVSAKATDNQGATTSSATVNLVVNAAPAPNQPPTVTLTAPANNAQFTAPATISLSASASDADGSVTKVEFYNSSTKLGESTVSPYQFSWTNVAAGTYTLSAKATDNKGAITTSATVMVQVSSAPVTPPTSTDADILGPDCVSVNTVKVFELNAKNQANATGFSWWCNGSTQSITPAGSKATYNFGPYYTGGSVCVGVNYSVSPWYKSYCKPVTICAPGARAAGAEQADNLVFPNPATSQFTFTAERNIQAMTISDEQGRSHLQLGATKAGQTTTFGEKLPVGTYLLQIRYEDQKQRTVKLLKVGN